jgi:hypothetical protein
MKIMFAAAVLLMLTASPGAALEQRNAIHATPPLVPHPMPQGMPVVVVGKEPDPIVELRYGVVHGKRVLLNGRTMEVVYILHP